MIGEGYKQEESDADEAGLAQVSNVCLGIEVLGEGLIICEKQVEPISSSQEQEDCEGFLRQ